jgi:hypothetical protein
MVSGTIRVHQLIEKLRTLDPLGHVRGRLEVDGELIEGIGSIDEDGSIAEDVIREVANELQCLCQPISRICTKHKLLQALDG